MKTSYLHQHSLLNRRTGAERLSATVLTSVDDIASKHQLKASSAIVPVFSHQLGAGRAAMIHGGKENKLLAKCILKEIMFLLLQL